jgi:hypothetical protein
VVTDVPILFEAVYHGDPVTVTHATPDEIELLAGTVLSALVPTSIAGSMMDEIFQAASNTLKTVAVRRRKWNLR